MLEKALVGTKRYYGLLAILAGLFALGFLFYLKQLNFGLGITGMGRDGAEELKLMMDKGAVTLAQDAELAIVRAPIVLRCAACESSFSVEKDRLDAAACPACAGSQLDQGLVANRRELEKFYQHVTLGTGTP